MADFFTQLFESIFTPGPTPSIVVATNASFAALQLLLLTLVVATWNVHFMILSVLSAGLWWAINWFVRELNLAKSQDGTTKDGGVDTGGVGARRHAAGEDSGTETEDTSPSLSMPRARASGAAVDEDNMRLRVVHDDTARRASLSGTDSEWDKIDAEDDEGPGNL